MTERNQGSREDKRGARSRVQGVWGAGCWYVHQGEVGKSSQKPHCGDIVPFPGCNQRLKVSINTINLFFWEEGKWESQESDLWPWLVKGLPNVLVKMSAAISSVGNIFLSQPLACVYPRREPKGHGGCQLLAALESEIRRQETSELMTMSSLKGSQRMCESLVLRRLSST